MFSLYFRQAFARTDAMVHCDLSLSVNRPPMLPLVPTENLKLLLTGSEKKSNWAAFNVTDRKAHPVTLQVFSAWTLSQMNARYNGFGKRFTWREWTVKTSPGCFAGYFRAARRHVGVPK